MATPARADIIVNIGVNNQNTENVLLDDLTDVAIVTGETNQSHTDVFFDSSGGNLSTAASGQARVIAGANNNPFNNIAFYLAAGTYFERAVFNLNSADDGDVLLEVTGVNIDGNLFSELIEVDANGQNFYTIDAVNGQLINRIELTGQAGVVFQDLRQVRLGGGDIPDVPDNVPEPASLLLFGLGLAGVAYRARRR